MDEALKAAHCFESCKDMHCCAVTTCERDMTSNTQDAHFRVMLVEYDNVLTLEYSHAMPS